MSGTRSLILQVIQNFKKCFLIRIQVGTGLKGQTLGVVIARSDTTSNSMEDEEGYSNITVLQDIHFTQMPDIRQLKEAIKPSKTNKGDVFSAVPIAIGMLDKFCGKSKTRRKIILVTDGTGHIDTDDVEPIAEKMKSDGTGLTILGVDFDDAEFGFKEEDKDSVKKQNEATLQSLCDKCDGAYGTMAYAISELGIPRLRSINPTPSYKGFLTLGNPFKYDSALSIAVERYPKTKLATAPSASKFVVKSDTAATASTQTSGTLQNGEDHGPVGDGLAAVKAAYTYQADDPSAPGGKREIERNDLAKGYSYGRTVVPFEDSDKNVAKLETKASFDIVGFVPADSWEHHLGMSSTSQIIGSKVNQQSAMALSSFIHALHEESSYAVARLVTKDDKAPILVLLAPFFDVNGFECLIDVELPFAEDMRSFTFPPLDKVVTVGGKHITKHRNLPNDELMEAMSDYVDAMDISTFGRTDGGLPTEYADPETTYSARNGRLNQAIQFRAINPYDEVPAPRAVLSKYAAPPEELLKQAKSSLDAVVKAADVKKVPPKQKGRKRGRDTEKPLSGLNVEELLGREKRVKITAENAIPEFKQLLETTEDMGQIKDAVKQLSGIIQSYIRDSTGNFAYNRAVEAIRVMKEEMREMEEPGLFNDFLRELKKKIQGGELKGDRREMWYLLKANRLGLIDSGATELSDVSPDDAKAVSIHFSPRRNEEMLILCVSSSS